MELLTTATLHYRSKDPQRGLSKALPGARPSLAACRARSSAPSVLKIECGARRPAGPAAAHPTLPSARPVFDHFEGPEDRTDTVAAPPSPDDYIRLLTGGLANSGTQGSGLGH
jgi:hypothetical protein